MSIILRPRPDTPAGGDSLPSSRPDELGELRTASAARQAQAFAWWDVVLRGKWIMLATVVAVLIPWTWYVMRQPSRYRASSVVLMRQKDGDLSNVLPTNARAAMFGQNDRRIGNEMLVIRESFPLARQVAARLIEARYVPGTREPLTVLRQGPSDVESVARRLQQYFISVSAAGRDVDGITISAVSTVPGEASFISNLFAEEYVRRTQDDSRSGYRSSREFLQTQMTEQAARLREQEAALGSFMQRSGSVDLDAESANMVEQLASLQASRDETQILLQMKRSQSESLQRELNAIQPEISRRLASGVDQQLTALQRRIGENEGFVEQILARNPELREPGRQPDTVRAVLRTNAQLRERVSQLSAQLLDEAVAAGGVNPTETNSGIGRVADMKRQLVSTLIESAGLEGKSRILNSRIQEYEGNLNTIPGQAIQLAQLQRARQSTERLFLALEEKLQEASVAEQSKLGYAELIRPAFRPSRPFAPRRQRNVLLGLVASLGLGLGLAVMRVALDHRIHRPEDLRNRGYTVLGVVPDLLPMVKREFNGLDYVQIEGHRLDTRLVTVLNPIAPQSESYRSLRTAIHFSQPDRPIRSLVVTSSNPSEGKSVTALNLAASMAQAGVRVVLVDADLRKPSIHTKMGLTREPGLVELLFKEQALDLELFRTPIDDLYVIPAGVSAPNPAELVGSRAMEALGAQLLQQFDIVIYDTPPVLVATDSSLLAARSDATLMVVSAGSTKDYEIDQAMESLASAHSNIVGIVLNRFEASKAYAYRYRYQAYQYNGYNYYGYGQKTDA